MVSTLMLELTSILCAFLLPRLIMVNFGSEYNGIVSSVTQFLSFVTLLRGGIGGVTKAALYKPLLERDHIKISEIVKATENFMRKVSYIFTAFLIAFAGIYPAIVREEFGWFYAFSLVLILGISTISQYYFGITYQMLIYADQRQYIYNTLQIIATVVNTILSVAFINLSMDFRLVKLASAAAFGLIPVALRYYVHKQYVIIKDVKPDYSAIRQRWAAFAHQASSFINSNTDVVILTLLRGLYEVAIYSVYFMVANGVKRLVNVCSNGIEAGLGNIIARQDEEKLRTGVQLYELLIHTVSTVFFSCAAMLIVPFIKIYTSGVTDANYIQPLLGYLLCAVHFISCIRLPYQNTVEAAGHFAQTRSGAIEEAAINIILTLILVPPLGCVGAVIGTLASTSFRTVQYAVYASKHLLHRNFWVFARRMLVTLLNAGGLLALYFALHMDAYLLLKNSYIQWLLCALVLFAAVCCITLLCNFIFYRNIFQQFLKIMFGRLSRREIA